MNLLSRITRIFRADLHGVMDQLENRDLLLKQYLREMKDSLQTKERKLRQIAADLRQNENREREIVLEIDTFEEDLTLALHQDKDNTARMLIRQLYGRKKLLNILKKQNAEFREKEEEFSSLLNQQKILYTSMKTKAAAVNFSDSAADKTCSEAFSDFRPDYCVDENMIELELLRRKETLQKVGGAS